MNSLLKNFTRNFEEHLTDFLWREWSNLGVFGASTVEPRWIIDPEVLLLLTSEIARHDARLFDEVLDWLKINSRWINTQRLCTLHTKHEIGDPHVLAAIAYAMKECGPATKWRKLSQITGAKEPPEALFRHGYQSLLSVVEEPDPIFEQYGLLRPVVSSRSLSQPVTMQQSSALHFRLRALFGLGMRADILCYLLTHDEGHPSGVATVLGYSQKRVQDTMVEMAESGQILVRPKGRLKSYWLDQAQWATFLIPMQLRFPDWIDWCHLAKGLTKLWRGIWAINPAQVDDYVASSIMRSIMRDAQDDLHACGIGFRIEDDRGHIAEDYLPVFIENIQRILGPDGMLS